MNFEEFYNIISQQLKAIKVQYNEDNCRKLYQYMNILLEWNKKINLTAITNENEVITKHFIDSLTINEYIESNSKIIDVGTGAGFPGLPLALFNEDCNVTLLDSLNKRILFLNEVINDTKIGNVITVHGRAEDFGQDRKFREKYDIAVSRAVAPLNVLVEYLLPFVKVGGKCICMKGPKANEELTKIEKSLIKLGGKLDRVYEKNIDGDGERNLIIIKKIKETNTNYPRKAGIPSKKPIS